MKRFLLLACVVSLCVFDLRAAEPSAAIEEMTEAADSFLKSLTPQQQEKAYFDFKNDERFDWHFVPKSRKGLPIKEMTRAQRDLAHALLDAALTQEAYIKATTIMSLDSILKDIEKGKGPTRDPQLYYVTIFNRPSNKGTWGWRIEGHHLSANMTIVDGVEVAGTPSFFGANPAEVKDGPRKGLRTLAAEEDLGRQLIKSLDAGQKAIAVFSTNAPKEIVTGNQRKIDPLKPTGLLVGKMTPAQKEVLMKLLGEYINRYRPEIANSDWEKIHKAGDDKIAFAWAGGFEHGQPHYYRIQGPTFLMEYDNTQNNANHVHAVWRDFANDFGEDLLRKHYEQTPH
jgi:hypothetical protein